MARNVADGYASDDECPTRPLPDGYGALDGDPERSRTRKRSRLDAVQYSIQQTRGRPSRHEEAARRAAAQLPPRRTGAEIRPRISLEYHKALLDLVKKSKVTCMKSDLTILREHHRFLWDHDDAEDTWELRLAKRYYDRLFKEYVICDLTGYRKGQVGFRWRTQSEVLQGRGQFTCGHKFCSSKDDLKSYEVDFKYSEAKCQKRALVKVRLCQDCAFKLHYRRLKKARKRGKDIPLKAADPVENDEDGDHEEGAAAGECAPPGPESDRKESGPSAADLNVLESLAWRQPDPEVRTREDDIDDYLRELFL